MIYELYDCDPMQSGDCAWHEPIDACGIDDLRRQAAERVAGYEEYPEGTCLWYIGRSEDGVEEAGSFVL